MPNNEGDQHRYAPIDIERLRTENARLQEQVEEADEVVVLVVAALNERVQEVALLKRERDDYKALGERHWRALQKWRMGGGHLHGAVVDTDRCPACLETKLPRAECVS